MTTDKDSILKTS